MAYDSPKMQIHHVSGPIFCSVAAGVKMTAAVGSQIGTSVATNDRLHFFKDIKITGFQARTRSGAAANAHALTFGRPAAKLLHGTVTLATALLGTVAGVFSIGGVNADATKLEIPSGTNALHVVYKMSNGASIGTHSILTAAAQSYDAFIEWQETL